MKATAAFLALVVITLSSLGLGTLASITATERLVSQGAYFVIAMVVAIPFLFIPASFWTKRWIPIPLIAVIIVGLVVVHVPGLGKEVNGAVRWVEIVIGGKAITFQPSEMVKIVALLLLAWWMHGPARKRETHFYGITVPFIGLGVVALGFLRQKDYGSIVMFSAVVIPMMLVYHASWKKMFDMAPYAIVALIAFGVLVMTDPVRRGRIESWFMSKETTAAQLADDPAAARMKDARYQINQSLNAFKAGGVTGVGYTKSRLRGYLPENHTDFVFAMIGEQFGFVGTVFTISLFLVFFMFGLSIAARAPDIFSALAAFGLTLHIILSAGVNAAMVLDITPTKGLAMPFISYGGSNLLCSVIAAAILFSICWNCKRRRRTAYAMDDGDGVLLPRGL